MPYKCDYTGWREVTEHEPESKRLVLIGTSRSYPAVAVRSYYIRDGVEILTNEFCVPASGKRIRAMKSRPIYWHPIEGC